MPQGISGASIRGFEQVIANFNKEVIALKDRNAKGLQKMAKFIRRDMDNTIPLIPVDLGNLRDSWQQHSITVNGERGIEMGFYASYALWVHEMMGAVHWSKAGSGPKFFEQAIMRNWDVLLQIIASETKIP